VREIGQWSAKHVAKVGSSAPLRKIEHFFAESKDLSVNQAEALFTEFIMEHNIPIACADHAGPLFKKMFPDSSIATKYKVTLQNAKPENELGSRSVGRPYSLIAVNTWPHGQLLSVKCPKTKKQRVPITQQETKPSQMQKVLYTF